MGQLFMVKMFSLFLPALNLFEKGVLLVLVDGPHFVEFRAKVTLNTGTVVNQFLDEGSIQFLPVTSKNYLLSSFSPRSSNFIFDES